MDEKTRPVRRRAKTRWLFAAFAMAAVALGAAWLSRPAPPPPGVSSGETMRAVVYHAYGPPDVLRLERVDKLLPNDDQVLIRVRAAAANPLDWHYMRGTPYQIRVVDSGLRRPSDPRLGRDVAGEVVAVGRSVTLFKPGDAVFGTGGGSFAEYVRASEKRIAAKPPGLTY